MISRSGESLLLRIRVMRTATLSMNHTPRPAKMLWSTHQGLYKITTVSSCAILRSPGSHRSNTTCGRAATKASLVSPIFQTMQKPPVPRFGCSKDASAAPTNLGHGSGEMLRTALKKYAVRKPTVKGRATCDKKPFLVSWIIPSQLTDGVNPVAFGRDPFSKDPNINVKRKA